MSLKGNRRFLISGLAGITVVLFFSILHHTSITRDQVTQTPISANLPAAHRASPLAFSVTPSLAPASSSDAAHLIHLNRLRSKEVWVTLHKVALGENYWTIAKKAKIDLDTLMGANPYMPFQAKNQMTLYLLSQKGVLHTVERGDTLWKLSRMYQTSEKVITGANGIHWWNPIQTGDVLFIPNVKPVRMIQAWKDDLNHRQVFRIPFARWRDWASGLGLAVDPTSKIQDHAGVDLRARYGDPVYASASGSVAFTGIKGEYGQLIILDHAHGYQTYYGHLSKIYIHPGAKVREGTLVGRVGATGKVSGPELRFEIRLHGKPLNPVVFI